ncbi:reverse transcriptase [Gossypium australe]|uniref:Reverse transcriptase n=1 Tax=Gossypium australe TaxID=47621 RepID=A0A5B6VWV3_9ROSI|nr:reverse transcriptase [Gossypium australe]
METKILNQMERIRRSCGFQNGIDVDSDGSKGGLCLAWHNDATISFRSFSKRHIDVIIEDSENGSRWRFTGIYGSPYTQDRSESWDLLRSLRNTEELPWLVCRDFNEIMYGHEKRGGLPREERRMDAFKSALVDFHLIDVGYIGKWFTWERGNLPETNIQERLDRGLIELTEADRDDENLAELINMKIQLNFEIENDERYWEQRARINWLQSSDKNTSFFHKQATQQRRRNLIQQLYFEDGRETEEICEMEAIARSYFQNLFSVGRRGNYKYLLTSIDRCIYEEDNSRLSVGFTKEEIRAALAELGPTKAPREDGFLALFYQKCWSIVGEEVSSFCLKHLNEAKVIANCLHLVMDKCIDLAQCAFVPGRLISDNVLLAYEILHTLKQKKTGKKGFMAVKLNMSKAYDRVEWNFIAAIMK